jgi:hypothetical protein
MLKLAPLTNIDRKKHSELLKQRFNAQRTGTLPAPHDQQLIDYLERHLDTILLGTPSEIETFAGQVVNRFSAFSAYAARHKKGKSAADDLHKNTLAAINACLDYTWFSNQTKGWGAYALVEAYRLRICPYCQANHVNFHVEKVKGKAGAAAPLPSEIDLPIFGCFTEQLDPVMCAVQLRREVSKRPAWQGVRPPTGRDCHQDQVLDQGDDPEDPKWPGPGGRGRYRAEW